MNELSPQTSSAVRGASASHAGFVHLRVHSAYSLSESTLRLNKLAELAAADNQPAVAITDSFNLFGAFEFSQKMMKAGVQPIIGAVVGVRDAEGTGEVVLLAQNETGYKNLSDLVSQALLATDPAHKPEIPVEMLAQNGAGLLLLSGGYQHGFLGLPAAQGQQNTVSRRADWLKSVFGERAFIELQRHGRLEEAAAEELLLTHADETGLPLVATNDCHFETEQMHVPQRVLQCIANSERLASMADSGITRQHYFKSAEQMAQLFADLPEAVQNTLLIARRCSFVVGQRKPILPSTEAEDESAQLRHLAEDGLKQRLDALKALPNSYYDGSPEQEKIYTDRLTVELDLRGAKDHMLEILLNGDGAQRVIAATQLMPLE
ncbi:MAG: PHP domain-containing protein, partial [Pseudomonadota bacterium]|nr:PHP domain-containing protein [Pseudomonadota bacterium]